MTTEAEMQTDLVWGASEIGKLIGRSPRKTVYLLETARLPASKVGSQWVSSRKVLLEHIMKGITTPRAPIPSLMPRPKPEPTRRRLGRSSTKRSSRRHR
jgi:hypothetical protein